MSNRKTSILKNSSDVVLFLDVDGYIRDINEKTREVLGDVTGEKFEKLEKKWRLDSDHIYEINGRYFSVVSNELGLETIIIGRDITRIKDLEKELRESEERFRTLAEFLPVAVLVYQNDKYIFANRAAEEIAGYPRDELLGGVFWELFREKDREKIQEIIQRRLRGEEIPPYTIKFLGKNGNERIIKVYGGSVDWNNGSAGIMAIVDVTDIEKDKQRLRELTDLLSFINRILRHDLLNALTSVSAFYELYEETKEERFLKKLRDAIEKCISIVKNMKDFEALVSNEGELRPVRVREVVEEAAKGFNIPIKIEGDCLASADESLSIILQNVLGNAITHSGTDKITINIRKVGDFCEIRITDYGIGIPDEIKKRIFDEGFKHGEHAQTGMGLYIVKKLIKRMNGEVWVEDNIKGGAIFVLRFKCCNSS